MSGETMARALGWFSIGLGLIEAVATRPLARALALDGREGLVRTFGAREIVNGGGLLALSDPTPGIWARIVGDTLDLATLGAALRRANGRRGNVRGAIGAVAGVTALDIACLWRLGATRRAGANVAVRRTLSIGRPADELYRLWREPQTLSRLLGEGGEVVAAEDGRARWTIPGPRDRRLTWKTEIVDERPGELVRWRSVPDAAVASEGEITFRPAPEGWGTEAVLSLRITPPGGPLGALARMGGSGLARPLVMQLLRRFKSLAETGEIPTLDGQPAARAGGRDS